MFAKHYQTCLPAGSYCDVISGDKVGATCSGKTIVVGAGGTAQISIPNTDADPMVAIHAEVSVTRQKFQVLQFISKPLFFSLHFLVYALKFLVLAHHHSINKINNSQF